MKSFREFIKEEEAEDHLYHATYKFHERNIKKHGLKSNPKHKNWSDSEKGRVYLAKTPEVAHSHAETSDEAPEHHYNSGIVVYKVHKKHLDPSKIYSDKNVQDDDHTVEYHGDIPSEHLKVHSRHDT
jgi:hypothetical protein